MNDKISPFRFKLKKKTTPELLQALYSGMLYPRLIEEKMLKLLRQGKISKWFSGIGQEAISVGVTMALEPEDLIFTLHRNLGVFTARLVSLTRLIAQWQGKRNGFTKGRDRSFHFGSLEHNIVGMISHLGPQLSLAAGAALGYKLDGKKQIAVAFTGEGGTSEGEFHEALNLAAVWKLPVIFVVENNQYALSTPTSEQFVCKSIADKGKGYGMKSYEIDGNDVLEVYHTITKICKKIRKDPHPVLVECRTFRVRGHEEASGTKYVPSTLIDEWSARDPLAGFQDFLLEKEVIDLPYIEQTRASLNHHVETSVEEAFNEPDVSSTVAIEEADVYAPETPAFNEKEETSQVDRKLRYVDSIREGLWQAMDKDPKLILMGQDIAEYGGVFKVTEGFVDQFGRERVRNTPLCESAVIGAGIGLSLLGYRTMVEMQFADFVSCGFNQIVNNLAKLYYRWGHSPRVVIRMPTGGNVGAGPFHSQSTESWFVHVPGLKILYPSNAYDAKGLLCAALQDDSPVMYFEHKFLYRTNETPVPEETYTIPIGKAKVVRQGTLATVVTYGLGVLWATNAIKELNLEIEVLDLRSLSPLDFDTIEASVRKTGKLMILHEATLTGGVGGEIAAFAAEHLFEYLDAPIVRSASLDMPVPFAKSLEQLFLPADRFKQQLLELVSY
ncbi:MAG: dehydrogenase E1 component subunit alpha/beta [Saprospiraceae bacterium]|nr:dehydrogenase E1 component subunit alpha/beta [Saprospiraceae bacterium]